MLVLSRQKDETLILTVPPSARPTRIEVRVVDIRGDKVRLGTEAPKAVSIHRAEIQGHIDRGDGRRPSGAAYAR